MTNAHSVAACILAASLIGCANTPAGNPAKTAAPIDNCVRLDIEYASATDARRAALEKKNNAWQVVIPFAVAARYTSASQAAAAADHRLAQLKDESHRLGCSSHVRS